MKISLLPQPNAGIGSRLGDQLRHLLQGKEGVFERFELAVAFVKQSGLSRLAAEIRAFRAAGGRAIATAGINHKGTSKQGIQALLALFDEAYIFYDTSRTRTFHPKIYFFESKRKAVLFIGSGNLTKGGLFSNYEAQTRLDFDRSDPGDEQLLIEVKGFLKFYRDPQSPQVRLLDAALASQIERALSDEFTEIEATVSVGEVKGEQDAADIQPTLEGVFGSSHYPAAPPPDASMRPPRRLAARPRAAQPARSSRSGAVPPSTRGHAGFWKLLSNWDVNPGSAPGQIQIPIQFKSFFPALRDSRDPSAPRQGRFQDTEFSVRFRDGKYNAIANARYIVYPPGARPNSEGRFTFRDEAIFSRLSAGDMLVFSVSDDPTVVFEIKRIRPRDIRFGQLRGTGNARWGLLGGRA